MTKVLLTIILILCLLAVSFGLIVLFSFIAHKRRGLTTDADFVRKLLPGVDCGMCGNQNCTEFAKKVAAGECEPTECKLIRPENSDTIKKYFSPTYADSTKLVAMIKCKGGDKAINLYDYKGAKSCALQEKLHSGCKACKYACIGCGDCVKACRYGAIKINDRGTAEVIRSKCTGCGACVGSCPNNLITMNKLELSVGVICNNPDIDPAIVKKCEVGCTHCGACVGVCPVGAVSFVNNIPVIDPKKCIECYKCVIVCPRHTITRL